MTQYSMVVTEITYVLNENKLVFLPRTRAVGSYLPSPCELAYRYQKHPISRVFMTRANQLLLFMVPSNTGQIQSSYYPYRRTILLVPGIQRTYVDTL